MFRSLSTKFYWGSCDGFEYYVGWSLVVINFGSDILQNPLTHWHVLFPGIALEKTLICAFILKSPALDVLSALISLSVLNCAVFLTYMSLTYLLVKISIFIPLIGKGDLQNQIKKSISNFFIIDPRVIYKNSPIISFFVRL